MSKKTRRSKPYTIRLSDKAPCRVRVEDWYRFIQLGLIAPITNDGQPSQRVAQLCEGVVAWLDAGRIVLQNLRTKIRAFIRTSWTAIDRMCPTVISAETIYYWHCLTDRDRQLWDAQRAALR